MEGLRPEDPQRVGRYRLLKRLGSGGMGRVYLGQSPSGRPVAVKIIRAELADDAAFRQRFRQEVTAARQVGGTFTAPVVDADPDAPQPWMVTAYVSGPSLADAVASRGPLSIRSVLILAAGLAEGLNAVHTAGLVHRDLKPSNVLLARDGPRIIDFGISRAAGAAGLTRVGGVIGSPGFMSPEQAKGEPVGPASDIFSLGSVLAYAATGEPPFGDGTPSALLYRVVYGEPATANVPPELRPLIERCLVRDPGGRPSTDELLAELGEASPAADWLDRRVRQAAAVSPAQLDTMPGEGRYSGDEAALQPADDALAGVAGAGSAADYAGAGAGPDFAGAGAASDYPAAHAAGYPAADSAAADAAADLAEAEAGPGYAEAGAADHPAADFARAGTAGYAAEADEAAGGVAIPADLALADAPAEAPAEAPAADFGPADWPHDLGGHPFADLGGYPFADQPAHPFADLTASSFADQPGHPFADLSLDRFAGAPADDGADLPGPPAALGPPGLPARRGRSGRKAVLAAVTILILVIGGTLALTLFSRHAPSSAAGSAAQNVPPAIAQQQGTSGRPGTGPSGRARGPAAPGTKQPPRVTGAKGGSKSPSPSATADPTPTVSPSPTPSPLAPNVVVLDYFAAIGQHRWATAWALGGDNLYATLTGLIAEYASVKKEQVTILSVSGDLVTARVHTTMTGGATVVHTQTFIVKNGVIVSRGPAG